MRNSTRVSLFIGVLLLFSSKILLAQNTIPEASNDSYLVNEDEVLTVDAPGVLTNDTDADGDALTAVLNDNAANGTLNLNADGSFTYTPNPDFNGSDSFTYHATDGTENSNIATVNITVNAVVDNTAPVASADSYSVDEDAVLTVTVPGVLGNDTDADGNPLTAVLDDNVVNGTLTLNADGSFTYTPNPDFNGSDSFTYHASDGTENSNIATVNITVNDVVDNTAPVANTDSYTVDEDEVLTVAALGVLGNDTDADANPLTAVLNDNAANGTLTLNADGSFTYTPNPDFNGSDSFTYHASDGTENSNIATVNITVNDVVDNTAPVASNDSYSVDEDAVLTVTVPGVLGNDTDADGDALTAVLNDNAANGTLTLDGDGSFTYTPNADFNGSDSFTYHASDGTENSNIAAVNITVNAVVDNTAPVASADSYSLDEDAVLTVTVPGVLGNDTDADGNPLTAVLDDNVVNGTLALNADGSFAYTPNPDFNGSDSFTYHASDGTENSNIATVNITVNAVVDNTAPVANTDSYTVDEDEVLTVAAPGVLGNDTDADANPLTAVLNDNVANGTLTLNADGSFTYTPNPDFNGSDSFTYHATDGTENSNIATVNITVNDVVDNTAPVASDDSYSVDEDALLTVTVPGVLGNDTDADGDALTAVLNDNVANGTLTLNADGSFTYTPSPDFNGSDSFTYHASDGTENSNIATVNITVNAVVDNTPPLANTDSYNVDEDEVLTVAAPGVLGNDTDADGNSLTAELIETTTNGTLSLNANGSFTYASNTDFNGSDSFTYQANDGTVNSSTATVNITINEVVDNTAPVASNDIYTVNEDEVLTVAAPGLLTNDLDAEMNPLTVALMAMVSRGSLSLNADGGFSYTPEPNYHGNDNFTYRAHDGTENSNVATTAITISSVNDIPIAVGDAYTAFEDTPLVVESPGLLTNDTDVDEDPLVAVVDTNPSHGSVTINNTGGFTYTPTTNYSGNDSFTYHASDGAANSNIVSAAITVNAVAEAPVATDDTYMVNEDEILTVAAPGVLGNDTDDGGTITAIFDAGPSNGTLTLNTDGSFSYTPNTNYNGPDSFTYRANDGAEESDIATVNITVSPVNDAPVAVNDAYSVDEDEVLTVAAPGILGNDNDEDEDDLSAVLIADVANGTLTLNADGSFTYAPNPDFNGSDSFTYQANDETVNSTTATVNITVSPVNDAPVAVNDAYSVDEDEVLTVAAPGILGNDNDEDGDDLSAVLIADVANGTLTLNADGSFTYAPNPDFNGTDSFTYQANDATVNSTTATVNITVNPVADNTAPVAVNDAYSVDEDEVLTVTAPGVLGNDTDADGNSLTADLIATTTNGTLTLNSDGSFTYTPNPDFNGSDSFTYQADDATVNSTTATVNITINPVADNTAPVASNDAYSVDEDEILTIAAPGVLDNDMDAEMNPLTASLMAMVSSGSLTLDDDGGFSYTPTANFHGSVNFTYRAFDGTEYSNVATTAITISSVNDIPIAVGDTYTAFEDTPLVIAPPGLLTNDSDVDGDPLTAVVDVSPSNGTVVINNPGGFTYTPSANFNGTDSFTYHATDGIASSNIVSASITVNAVADAPVASNDAYMVNEDGTLTVDAPGVLGNDTDDGGTLSAVHDAGPSNGTLILNNDGSFTYTPEPNFNGTDSFTYHANDGAEDSNVATVSITINSVNDPPTLNVISDVTVAEDAGLQTINLTGIGSGSANETQILTVTATHNNPSLLSAIVVNYTSPNATGSLDITPLANVAGNATVTVTVTDNGSPAQNIQRTFTFEVTDENDPPGFDALSDVAVSEDAAAQNISITGINPGGGESEAVTITATSDNPAVVPNPTINYTSPSATGTLTFQPVANRSGAAIITVTAEDASGLTFSRTFTITVNEVNDAPTLNTISNVTVTEDSPTQNVPIGGITSGNAFESQTLIVTATHNNPSLLNTIVVNYTSANATGSLDITPLANAVGTATVTVTVTDNGTPAQNIQRTFTFEVTNDNDPPSFAVINNVVVNEDANAQNITITGITPGAGETENLTITATSDNATVVPNPTINYTNPSTTAVLTFQPAANRSGLATITVTAEDAGGLNFSRTFTITVNEVNDAPTLNPISNVFVSENSPPQIINLAGITSGNAFESQTLTVTASHNNDALLDDPVISYTSANTTGTLTLTPLPNVSGTATVTVTVQDNGSSTAPNINVFQRTFSFTITDVNLPPTIDPISNVTVNEDAPSQNVNITGISPGASETGTVTITASSSDDSLIPDPVVTYDGTSATGSLVFQPVANRSGTVTITVRAVDNGGAEFTRTFAITVNEVNDAPTLNTISDVSVAENSPPQVVNLAGIGSGSPFESQMLTVTVSHNNPTLLSGVTVTYSSPATTGTLTVTPNTNVSGSAIVTVTVTDNGSSVSPSSNTFQRTFTFSVNNVNDPPTFNAINDITVAEDAGAQTVSITGISAGPGETETVTFSATSSNTDLVPNPTITYDGTSTSAILQFTPQADRFGSTTITVTAQDAGLLTFSRTFLITVDPVNDAPTLDPISNVSVGEDAGLQTINLSGISDGSEFESQVLTFEVTSDNAALFDVLAVNYIDPQVSGVLNVQPKVDVTGTANITVTVTDNGPGTAPNVNTFSRTFTFVIGDVNDPPTFNVIADVTVNEDASTQSVNITGISPGPGETQVVTLTASSSDETIVPDPLIVHDGTSPAATLNFQPVANMSGVVTITVRAVDVEALDFSRTFTITVQSINDAPTLDALSDITIQEDGPNQVINLTGISPGPLESSQTLTVTSSTNQPGYFDVFTIDYSSPQSQGTLTVSPAPDITGTSMVTVTVTDNGASGATHVNTVSRTFTLTISPENDPPVIIAQSDVSIQEDQPYTIPLSSITIQDPDNTSGFTISAADGDNYSVSGATITPDPHYYGPLIVPITVSDGVSSSLPFDFDITVTPVNDAPQIIGQNPVSIDEAQDIPIEFAMLIVDDHDPEDVYPDDYILTVLPGVGYSVIGLSTVRPDAGFSGILTVKVFVNDGQANSNTYDLQIQVAFVNDPPVITAQNTAISINEDEEATLSVTQLNITDPDNGPGDFTLTILPNTNYTFTGLEVRPNENFNGDLSVFVSVSDGFVNSAPFTMHITVNPVNDLPVIVNQNPVSTNEDIPVTLKLGDLIVTDVDTDDPYPSAFTMSASAGDNYTVSGTPALIITPALNYNGVLTVPVTVNDGQASSNTYNLQIQVAPVNDPPVIVSQDPNPLTTSEDIPVEIELGYLTISDVESTTGFTLIVQSGANYTFNGAEIIPALDYVGPLTVNIRVSDGSAQSEVFPFQIRVDEENDPPVISGQNTVTVQEDNSVEIRLSHLTIVDPDPNETFTLLIMPPAANANYTVNGTTITPIPNFYGNLSVPVRVNDGSNNSNIFPMVIQVTPVNDAPSFNAIDDIIMAENSPSYTITISGISPGPLETEALLMTINSSNTQVIEAPSVTYNGTATNYTFSIIPKPNQTGEVVITVTVTDPGLLQFSQSFNVSVTNINDPPTLDPITVDPIDEGASLEINLTGITAGPQESQALEVFVSSDKEELFETLSVKYTSPNTFGLLNIVPKADAFGTAEITVRVEDDGSNEPPNQNFIERTFTLTISPINDPPVFESTPVDVAVIGEVYEYNIEVIDVDAGDVITITAVNKPDWLTLTPQSSGRAVLSGTPPPNAVGAVSIRLQAMDQGNAMVLQEYTLRINTRPVVNDFSIVLNEDELKSLELSNFTSAFTDEDGDALQTIQITRLPEYGQLLLNSQAVYLDQEIPASSIGDLDYRPDQDYYERDTIEWKGADALSFSLNSAQVFFNILPVNDPPEIVDLETEILEFHVGEGPGIISTEFMAIDVDNVVLTGAEIGFRRQNFVPEVDWLYFEDTPNIQGEYDEITGILTLTGSASVEEYNIAIRSITYDNVSEAFTDQEVVKTIYYTLSDGIALSATRDREIRLVDLFEELVIPKGFTPNTSDDVNSTWSIANIERYTDAIVKVYNIRGLEVYSSQGIYEEWDGTFGDKALPSDTYYYVIDLNLPFRKKVYTGAVTILR